MVHYQWFCYMNNNKVYNLYEVPLMQIWQQLVYGYIPKDDSIIHCMKLRIMVDVTLHLRSNKTTGQYISCFPLH